MNNIESSFSFLSNTKDFHFYLIGIFCFLLPLWPDGAVLMIILLFVNNLLNGCMLNNIRKVIQPLSLLSISLYLIYLIGLTYTTDMADGLSDVETKLTLFIFPLLIFAGNKLDKKQMDHVLMAFVIGCLFVALRGTLWCAYYEKVKNITSYFTNTIGIHSSFFCIYLGLCIFFLAQRIQQKGTYALSKKGKKIIGGLLLCCCLPIFFLRAKMGFFTLAFLFPIFYMANQYKKGATLQGIIKTAITLCLVAIITWIVPASKGGFYGKINIPTVNITEQEDEDVRIAIWTSSLETAQKQILFGVGTGDVHVELEKTYKKRNFDLGLKHQFNPHNQYLQTSIALGIIGLLILLFNFLYPMKLALQKRYTIYLFFLLLFAMGCLTESLLERECGVLFFAFFNSLFARELGMKSI